MRRSRASMASVVLATLSMAACRGALRLDEISRPARSRPSGTAQHVYVAPFVDMRATVSTDERWRAKSCAFVRSRNTAAIPLEMPVTEAFRRVTVLAIEARGHRVVDLPGDASITVRGSVTECTLRPVVGLVSGGALVRLDMDLALSAAPGSPSNDRRQSFENLFPVALTRSGLVDALRQAFSAWSQRLVDDAGLGRSLERLPSAEDTR